MTRERQVFPTSEIPHKWAHQTQAEARNPQGNLYFKGATIYSYRDSWPLARIYRKRDGRVLVLTNSDRYGNTTVKHQRAVNYACQHMPRIPIPFPAIEARYKTDAKREHGKNLAALTKGAADHLSKAQRAMSAHAVTWRRINAQTLYEQSAQYLKFFGIRRKAPAFPAAAWAAALERATRIETPDPVLDARKIKQRDRRREKMRAELQSAVDAYCAQVATYNAAFDAAMAALPAVDAAQIWRDTGKWPNQDIDVTAEKPYMAEWGRHGLRNKLRNAGFIVPEVKSMARVPIAAHSARHG